MNNYNWVPAGALNVMCDKSYKMNISSCLVVYGRIAGFLSWFESSKVKIALVVLKSKEENVNRKC